MKTISKIMTFYFPMFAVLLALTVIAISCSDSEEELARIEQIRLDSIAIEDSLDAIVRAEEQRVQDSTRVVADSLAILAAAEEAEKAAELTVEPGVFTVQIASYDNSEDAQPFYGELTGEGLNPYIIEELALFGDEERVVYRLRFGKYGSKDEAHNRGSEVALRHELDYWVDNYRR